MSSLFHLNKHDKRDIVVTIFLKHVEIFLKYNIV